MDILIAEFAIGLLITMINCLILPPEPSSCFITSRDFSVTVTVQLAAVFACASLLR